MFQQLLSVFEFVIDAFLHVWPYILITIPLAVAVQMSGASKYIGSAFQAKPVTAIFLATAVGAFSPFCSCGVIPVVAALLIGGVPLAPVMAFWLASPSMDPEIFFLSVATIGWELAIWRLVATLILSLSAGFITHYLMQQDLLGQSVLRTQSPVSVKSNWVLLKQGLRYIKQQLTLLPGLSLGFAGSMPAAETVCCSTTNASVIDHKHLEARHAVSNQRIIQPTLGCGDQCSTSSETENANSCSLQPASIRQRLLTETWTATAMVLKFMALAFVLEALIILFVPTEIIVGLLGQQNPLSIIWATVIGVPMYTSNLAALPMVSGLLTQGMAPAAGLAFLIAGPTTTLPAMAAVWGLTSRRIFVLYVSFSLVGAIVLAYMYHIATTVSLYLN